MNIFSLMNINTNQGRILSTLILTGFLSVGNGLIISESSIAAPTDISLEINREAVKENFKNNGLKNNGLPRRVARTVLRDLSRRENIAISQLKIVSYQEKSWTDSCLGLGGPAEICSQVVVPGWEVKVGDGNRTWTYRTNKNGRLIRLADSKHITPEKVPSSVKNRVLKAASQHLRQPISRLSIVKTERKTWNDTCLELGGIAESCLRTSVPGWRLVVRTSKQTLVYHSNEDGSEVRLNERASDNRTDANLPQNIKYAVLKDAASWSKIPPQKLSIIKAQRKIWDNPCFLKFERYCNFAFIKTPGWIVTVKGGTQTWVYHTNDKGSMVLLDRTPSLSKAAATAIKRDAVKRSLKARQRYFSSANFRIIEAEKLKNWNGKRFRKPGWKATVSNGKQSWVYKVSENGSEFQFLPVASLPQSIVDAVIADVKVRAKSRVRISENNIVAAKPVRWRNSCLGLRSRRRYCAMRIVDGWQITVKAGSESFVYHTNNKSRIKFNATASRIIDDIGNYQTLPISRRELPAPLNEDTIFRQVSSSEFSGLTYQMVLLKDGRLMLSRVGDFNDSSRAVWRISPSQLRKFQSLLQRNRQEFRNVTYPASRGAADYKSKTYMLTSDRGSVQYNDVSYENIPKDLQVIVQAWNGLIRSARR